MMIVIIYLFFVCFGCPGLRNVMVYIHTIPDNLFFKEINTFIAQRCIKFVKSDSKYIECYKRFLFQYLQIFFKKLWK